MIVLTLRACPQGRLDALCVKVRQRRGKRHMLQQDVGQHHIQYVGCMHTSLLHAHIDTRENVFTQGLNIRPL